MCLDLKPAVKTNNATCTVKKRAGYTDAQLASFQRVYIPLQPIGPPRTVLCVCTSGGKCIAFLLHMVTLAV